ncbi:tannase and feruloyl esterase [Colletotrichum orchidophilum]|uniref:Carboxylic ester hydrolase n=1 Tax=Colletotrichum orchidophilum TaxID=1209926 RepID=A0A1G4BSA8_9PEZI|nr:tannase and feruloyl esterase [Colletotrichum orchidophilum]OHF04147.1 tannase and feruloyl esterase [Colletotrichum orchidophilum]
MVPKHVPAPPGLLFGTALLAMAGLATSTADTASVKCQPGTFHLPDIPGVEHVRTTAAVVRNYTGFPNRQHEPALSAPAASSSGIAPFCNVTVSYTHPGQGDLVNVHVWLPLETRDWNGRFMGLGGGGFVVGEVDGDAPSAAVQEGYVAAATDGGHLAAQEPYVWALKSTGNLDWPLLVNFGYRSLHELAVVGKSVAREYYGRAATYAYWKGCSTGGRQGLTVAQRYPGDFDGVLSMCPAVEFPAMVVAIYFPQLVMRWRGYWPSECELRTIVAAGVERCDLTDGKKDGIIGRLGECGFDVRTAEGRAFRCDDEEAGRTEGRVSKEAVEVVEEVVGGILDEEGRAMFPSYVPGTQFAGFLAMMNSVCEDEKDRTRCKGVPFPVSDAWIRLFVEKDAQFEPESMSRAAYRDVFRRSVEEFDSVIGTPVPDLRRFRERGGKVLMWHGMADQAVPVNVGRALYEKARGVEAARGVELETYWRYFEVPGVNHCVSMEGAPFPWDAFARLRAWVEDGVVPDELEARGIRKGEGGGFEIDDEVRRICLYPLEGVWDGKRWTCLKPGEKIGTVGEKEEL